MVCRSAFRWHALLHRLCCNRIAPKTAALAYKWWNVELFCALLFVISWDEGCGARIFTTRLCGMLGGASYWLYLLHVPVGWYYVWYKEGKLPSAQSWETNVDFQEGWSLYFITALACVFLKCGHSRAMKLLERQCQLRNLRKGFEDVFVLWYHMNNAIIHDVNKWIRFSLVHVICNSCNRKTINCELSRSTRHCT